MSHVDTGPTTAVRVAVRRDLRVPATSHAPVRGVPVLRPYTRARFCARTDVGPAIERVPLLIARTNRRKPLVQLSGCGLHFVDHEEGR